MPHCPHCPMHQLPISPTLTLPRYTDPNLTLPRYTDRPHTLGAELASLRELLFPETKQHFWGQMLDAAAPVQPPKWTKENPPVVVTVNRHRAAKERPDRRAKMSSSSMAQLVLYLPLISRISPPYLPYISPISRGMLASQVARDSAR